jgi:hypothetical protein
LSAQKVQVTGSLKSMDIVPTPLLLLELLPLNELAEQLGLGGITSARLGGGGGCCDPLPLKFPKPSRLPRVAPTI